MTTDELIAVLRLQNIPNIGDVSAKKLIAHCGSPAAIFNDKLQNLLKIDGIGTFTEDFMIPNILKLPKKSCSISKTMISPTPTLLKMIIRDI